MAIQLTDYSSLPIQGNPMAKAIMPAIKSGLDLYKSGVSASYLPKEKQQDLQRKIYENMVKSSEAKYAEPKNALDLQQKQYDVAAAPYTQMMNIMNIKSLPALLAHPEIFKKILDQYASNLQKVGTSNPGSQQPDIMGLLSQGQQPEQNQSGVSQTGQDATYDKMSGFMGYLKNLFGHNDQGQEQQLPQEQQNNSASDVSDIKDKIFDMSKSKHGAAKLLGKDASKLSSQPVYQRTLSSGVRIFKDPRTGKLMAEG